MTYRDTKKIQLFSVIFSPSFFFFYPSKKKVKGHYKTENIVYHWFYLDLSCKHLIPLIKDTLYHTTEHLRIILPTAHYSNEKLLTNIKNNNKFCNQ